MRRHLHIIVANEGHKEPVRHHFSDDEPWTVRRSSRFAVQQIRSGLESVEYYKRLPGGVKVHEGTWHSISAGTPAKKKGAGGGGPLCVCTHHRRHIPYFFFHSVNVSHGYLPNWRTLPRIGIPVGPGGSLVRRLRRKYLTSRGTQSTTRLRASTAGLLDSKASRALVRRVITARDAWIGASETMERMSRELARESGFAYQDRRRTYNYSSERAAVLSMC
jgi:hypothetical protein